MDYTIPGGLALNMADGWVLQQLIATAGYTAKKGDDKEKINDGVTGPKTNWTEVKFSRLKGLWIGRETLVFKLLAEVRNKLTVKRCYSMKTLREEIYHNLNIIWLYCVFNGKADLIPYSVLRTQCCHCWAQTRGRKLHWINEDRLVRQFTLPLTTVTWWTLPPPGTNSRGSEYPAGGAGRGLATPSLFQSPTAAVPLLRICLFYHPVQHTQWWLTKELNLGSLMTKHRHESHN